MTAKTITLNAKIPALLEGKRLDQALAALFPDYSRSQLQKWIQQGHVTLDHTVQTQQRYAVQADQTIAIHAVLQDHNTWAAQAMALPVVYEDNNLLIINKPADWVVHPGAGHPDHTLVNALLHYQPELKHLPRAGLIHRLDKGTSGLLVVARTLSAYHHLNQQMLKRQIKREYQAIVKGRLTHGARVDVHITRHPQHRTRMCTTQGNSGRHAVTYYHVLQTFSAHTHLQVILQTGRTHQIRVHMQHIGHPLVGDPVYGKGMNVTGDYDTPAQQQLASFNRQALHAARLCVLDPNEQKPMTFTAPLPDDMQQLLAVLAKPPTT